MAHFYGILDTHAKTKSTRCGTKKTGMRSEVSSWSYVLATILTHDPETGEDSYYVEVSTKQGKLITILAEGKLSYFKVV